MDMLPASMETQLRNFLPASPNLHLDTVRRYAALIIPDEFQSVRAAVGPGKRVMGYQG